MSTDGTRPYLLTVDSEPGEYFGRYRRQVNIIVPGSIVRGTPPPNGPSLRQTQLGAAFACAAHFSVSREPAIVSMPTGSGKSAVMTLLPFLIGVQRVLVVTPSQLLRMQLANEFFGLGVLRATGIVSSNVPSPRTQPVVRRLRTITAWEELSEFDVVVGTPNVLSPGYSDVALPPLELFDLVLIDEAHHAPAPTYGALLRAIEDVPAVLFTATPFRRDRHALPGVQIYSYGLGQALEDGVLAPISFRPVEVPATATTEERDFALAAAAIARVNEPSHSEAASRIIARTSTVAHAGALLGVYAQCGARMGLVTAATGAKQLRTMLAALRAGDLMGLVSVGVLGEGFDFRELKIGVYHQRHASLPATLQFLGRITRLVPDGPPAELFAVREEVNDETRELYASDVAWASLVPALADAAVAAEAERRRYLRGFDPTPTEPLSLSALRPRKDVQVFKFPPNRGLDLHTPLTLLGGREVIYQGSDADDRLAVIITEHLERPEWLDADTFDGWQHELHVVVRDPLDEFVFVHGSRDVTVSELLGAFGYEDPELVEPTFLDRLMNSLALGDYHSVGMRSARASGGRLAAYRQMAGTNVGHAVLPSETRAYGTGHAIARVQDPMTVTAEMVAAGVVNGRPSVTSLGVSYGRAKVFSPDLAQLLDFRRWCDRIAELARAQGASTPAGLPGLPLLSPRRINDFPASPYLATLDPTFLGQGLLIIEPVGGRITPLEQLEVSVTRLAPRSLRLVGTIDGTATWRATVDTAGVVASTDGDLIVQGPGGRQHGTLSEFLTANPLTVFYANGASTMGSVMFQPRSDYPDIGPNVLKSLPFDDVDIRAEAKNPVLGLRTIKDYMVAAFAADPISEYVIDDDRAGEVADLVVISRPGSSNVRIVTLV